LRGRRVEARRAGMTPSTRPRVGLRLVIWRELLLFGFAVGDDRSSDDDRKNDGKNDRDDAQQMECAVEGAGTVMGVDGAVGFLSEKGQRGAEKGSNGGDGGANTQSEDLGRFDLRSWGFYDGRAADVAAFFSAPLDAVSPPGGVAQMVRATDS
jgi:hypothetical protein